MKLLVVSVIFAALFGAVTHTVTTCVGQEKILRLHPYISEGKWGYTNGIGQVVIPAVYARASEQWGNGFAWVDLAPCDCGPLETAGDFINTNGVRLVGQHIHPIVSEPWALGWEPYFTNGLAFIRLANRDIYCISTNGSPITLHSEWGPFREYGYGNAHYQFEHGYALVRVKNGGYGLLNATGGFELLPTNRWNTAWSAWINAQNR